MRPPRNAHERCVDREIKKLEVRRARELGQLPPLGSAKPRDARRGEPRGPR